MEQTMMVRLHAYSPRAGRVRKRFCYAGIVFEAGTGWYAVDRPVAEYLQTVRQRDGDEHSALAFEVASEGDARKLDDQDAVKARRERPVDEAKAVDARPRAGDRASSEAAPAEPKPKARKG